MGDDVRRRLYFVWRKMVARCHDPRDEAFARYGGRGISVAEEWLTFARFFDDMAPAYSPGLTLEREDNDAGYSAENCRWATRREQQANTRKTILIEHGGERLPAREWSRRTGLHVSVILRRLRRGLPIVEVLRRQAS